MERKRASQVPRRSTMKKRLQSWILASMHNGLLVAVNICKTLGPSYLPCAYCKWDQKEGVYDTQGAIFKLLKEYYYHATTMEHSTFAHLANYYIIMFKAQYEEMRHWKLSMWRVKASPTEEVQSAYTLSRIPYATCRWKCPYCENEKYNVWNRCIKCKAKPHEVIGVYGREAIQSW